MIAFQAAALPAFEDTLQQACGEKGSDSEDGLCEGTAPVQAKHGKSLTEGEVRLFDLAVHQQARGEKGSGSEVQVGFGLEEFDMAPQ